MRKITTPPTRLYRVTREGAPAVELLSLCAMHANTMREHNAVTPIVLDGVSVPRCNLC